MLDARQLRYFVAIFECRNLSHAAERVHVAASALSHHLAQLEGLLGQVLFHRLPRGMEPTAAAVRLYDHARPILRALAAAEQDLRHSSEAVAGEVAVGLPFSVIEAIGLPLIETVLARYPKLRLTLNEALSTEVFRQLTAGEIDLGLCYNPTSDPRLALEPVVEEPLLCIGHHRLLGDTPDPMSFEAVTALPLLPLRPLSSRSVLDRPRLSQRLHDSALIELNSQHAMRKALVAGLGCSVIAQITVRDLLVEGPLLTRRIVEPALTRVLALGRPVERPASRAVETLEALIRALIAAEIASGGWQARWLGA